MPDLKTVLDFLQAAANIAAAIALIFAVRQIKLNREQLKKQSDNAAVNFVINAEGQFDSMTEALLGATPDLIASVHKEEVDPNWSEVELRSFVYLRRLYSQVSRMVYIVNDKTLDVGMDDNDRMEFLEVWERELRTFQTHPIMRRIHQNAVKHGNFNSHMLSWAAKVFDGAAK